MNQLDRMRRHYDDFNKRAAIWRRYEQLRAARRLGPADLSLPGDVLDWLDWLEANESRGPLKCIGFELECVADESRGKSHYPCRSS